MVLGLYGASGLGMEFLEIALDINRVNKKWEEIVIIDDDPEKEGTIFQGLHVLTLNKVMSSYANNEIEFIISIGEPEIKDIVYKRIKGAGYHLGLLIHPTSSIGSGAVLGEGVVIQSWNRIPPLAKIGNNVLIQGTTCLGHGIDIGDNAVISSFVFIGGGTKIGRDTYIAPHSCLRNGISVGSGSIVGMGSVVTKDIPDNVVAYGNPCEVKRINEKGRVFSK